jgi:hypothetical protein
MASYWHTFLKTSTNSWSVTFCLTAELREGYTSYLAMLILWNTVSFLSNIVESSPCVVTYFYRDLPVHILFIFYFMTIHLLRPTIAELVQRLTMGWMVRGYNPSGKRFSTTIQTSLGAHSASWMTRAGSVPGVQQPQHGINHTSHVALRLKKEYSYIFTFFLCLHGI